MKSQVVVVPVSIILAVLALPAPASAQDLRVVVLPKLTVEGAAGDSAALEATAIAAMQKKGLRVVELTAALAAQKAVFSDTVLAGKVPAELSVLNADALCSVQLACSKAADSILDSEIKAYYCVLSQKVVRVDSGDVAFGDTQDFTTHGLNGLQALQALLKGRLPGALDDKAQKWLAAWKGESGWEADLFVSRLKDRAAAEKLQGLLAKVPGVTGARMVVYKDEYAKFMLSGKGGENLKKLASALEASPDLTLKVTFASERVVHAEFSFDRAYTRSVAAYFAPPTLADGKSPARVIADRGEEILRSYLGNLGYLDVRSVEKAAAQDLKGAGRTRKVADLKKGGVPLLLIASFARAKDEWLSTLDLVASSDGKAVATAVGKAKDPVGAVEKSVRELDAAYRAAMTKKDTLARIGLGAGAAEVAAARGLVIESFEAAQVFPARLPVYRDKGVGTLTLRNAGRQKITDAEVRFLLKDAVVSSAKIADIAPGKNATVPVTLREIPKGSETGTQYVQLAAAVTYRAGETYGKSDAYAPLIVHQTQTIDWSEPRSVASFIDSANPAVRTVATKALALAKPAGAAHKKIAQAEAIFDSLWHKPLQYVADPVTTNFGNSIDSVQSPVQTMGHGAGDCDDLTVLLASLFESVGLATAVLVTPGHVLLGVESGALAGGHLALGLPKPAFVKVDGALFIPVEATAIGSGFTEAWKKGVEVIGRDKAKLAAFRTRAAWRQFPPLPQEGKGGSIEPDAAAVVGAESAIKAVAAHVKGDVPAWAKTLAAQILAGTESKLDRAAVKTQALAGPLVGWLGGDRASGLNESAALCAKGRAEACYNLNAMLAMETDRGDDVTAAAAAAETALESLPETVAEMLLDHGGVGLGDEASKDAEAKKKMKEALEKARQLIKKRMQNKKPREIKIAPVGGRKGKPAVGLDAAAVMFFWEPVDE
jgi:hypothetical protein